MKHPWLRPERDVKDIALRNLRVATAKSRNSAWRADLERMLEYYAGGAKR